MLNELIDNRYNIRTDVSPVFGEDNTLNKSGNIGKKGIDANPEILAKAVIVNASKDMINEKPEIKTGSIIKNTPQMQGALYNLVEELDEQIVESTSAAKDNADRLSQAGILSSNGSNSSQVSNNNEKKSFIEKVSTNSFSKRSEVLYDINNSIRESIKGEQKLASDAQVLQHGRALKAAEHNMKAASDRAIGRTVSASTQFASTVVPTGSLKKSNNKVNSGSNKKTAGEGTTKKNKSNVPNNENVASPIDTTSKKTKHNSSLSDSKKSADEVKTTNSVDETKSSSEDKNNVDSNVSKNQAPHQFVDSAGRIYEAQSDQNASIEDGLAKIAQSDAEIQSNQASQKSERVKALRDLATDVLNQADPGKMQQNSFINIRA